MKPTPAPRIRLVSFSILACTFVVIAAGCGSTSPSPPPPSSSPSQVGHARLTAVPGGTASVSRDPATGDITISFDIYGMTLRSIHAVVLRSGSCRSPGNQTVAVFPDLMADVYGAAKGTLTSVHGVPNIPAGSHLEIELAHGAQADNALGSTDMACADITTSGGSTSVALTPFPNLHPEPGGSVNLSYFSSGRLVIHVVASGLVPSTTHAGHIHFGSCQQQSGVLYSLGNLNADAQGNINSTITLTGITRAPPAQGWYADLHLAAVSGLEVGGQPTPSFQPVLCGNGSV